VSALRVIIVEDEVLAAMMLEDLLEDLGCDVVASFGGVDQALSWLANQDQPPDGAVLDVNLGGEMVFPFAEALVEREVPFAFATGYGALSDQRFAETPLINKPVNMGDLARIVGGFRSAA
jgi:two-component SAPR family response regulator